MAVVETCFHQLKMVLLYNLIILIPLAAHLEVSRRLRFFVLMNSALLSELAKIKHIYSKCVARDRIYAVEVDPKAGVHGRKSSDFSEKSEHLAQTSSVAQGKRAGLITRRALDRNQSELHFSFGDLFYFAMFSFIFSLPSSPSCTANPTKDG